MFRLAGRPGLEVFSHWQLELVRRGCVWSHAHSSGSKIMCVYDALVPAR